MSSTARAFTAVLLLSVLGLLAGCGGGDTVTSPRADAASKSPAKALVKGTCWGPQRLSDALGPKAFDAWVAKYAGGDAKRGESMRDDAAFSDEVDCADPHSLELYDVVRLTPSLDAKVKTYADLLDQGSALYRQVSDQVNERCLARSPYGRAQRKAGVDGVQLSPWISDKSGLHVAWDPFPADLWASGRRTFVCTFEQDTAGTLAFADLTTRKAPIDARVCLNTPRKYRPCAGRHQAEVIGELTVNDAVARGAITGRKAIRRGADGPYVALPDAQYARLDKVCQTFLSSVSDVGGGVVGRAYPGEVSQWPTKAGDYVASCFALKPFDPPPMITGTVFDRAG